MTGIQELDAERLSPTDASSLLGIPYDLPPAADRR